MNNCSDSENAKSWPTRLKAALNVARANHIRVGIFYNGNATDKSGKDWIDHGIQRSMLVEKKLGMRFDDVIFQSWMPYPNFVLPETDPDAMMNFMDRYIFENKH